MCKIARPDPGINTPGAARPPCAAAAPMSEEPALAGLKGNDAIDPRLALLLWASVKWDLVEAGFEDLDHAFDEIERALHIISPCQCEREILDRFERYDHERQRRWRR
jgi:hypothetical protein